MELWIRSQDRKILKKVNQLYVTTFNDELGYGIYDINHEDLDDCDISLGFYKTKERALKVLDEIQNALLNKWADNVKYEEHYDNEKPRTMVYEIPKE